MARDLIPSLECGPRKRTKTAAKGERERGCDEEADISSFVHVGSRARSVLGRSRSRELSGFEMAVQDHDSVTCGQPVVRGRARINVKFSVGRSMHALTSQRAGNDIRESRRPLLLTLKYSRNDAALLRLP